MYDSALVLGLRSVARRTGINKIVGALVGLLGYERAFGSRIISKIRPGDCVWDVGANVGLYTEQFLDKTGTTGKVVAFEPSRECFSKLEDKLSKRAELNSVNAALGARDGTATLFCAADPLAATHTLSVDAGRQQLHEGSTYSVPVYSADSFVTQHLALRPNIMKIDVEGFEADVIAGMNQMLADQLLRCIFIEVHFTLLEAQGKKDAPRQIVKKLRDVGFSVSWSDPSHIIAVRSLK